MRAAVVVVESLPPPRFLGLDLPLVETAAEQMVQLHLGQMGCLVLLAKVLLGARRMDLGRMNLQKRRILQSLITMESVTMAVEEEEVEEVGAGLEVPVVHTTALQVAFMFTLRGAVLVGLATLAAA
jgi:hypothetical protein